MFEREVINHKRRIKNWALQVRNSKDQDFKSRFKSIQIPGLWFRTVNDKNFLFVQGHTQEELAHACGLWLLF